MRQEGQPCAEEGRGPRHALLLLPTTSFTYFLLLLLLLTTYHPSERVLPNKVAPARGVHAMPEGGVGGGACTSRFLQLWVPGTNLLGPKLFRNDALASPPGARRKGRRALLPLATVRSRAEGIPRTNSKRVFSAKGQHQPAMQRGFSVASGCARGCRASLTCQRHRCLSATRYVYSHI